jgi:hypothetical protein
MRIVLPLVVLLGCTPPPRSDTNHAATRAATAPVTLTPMAEEDVCPPPAALASPFDYTDVSPDAYYAASCRVYDDVDVGGQGICCGGDLRVQKCGPGLECQQPYAGRIGICNAKPVIPDAWTPPDQYLCVDIWSPYVAPNDCFFAASRIDDGNCQLILNCGNSSHLLACEDGRCECFNEAAQLPDLPIAGVCGATLDAAKTAAQTRCAFPTGVNITRDESQW